MGEPVDGVLDLLGLLDRLCLGADVLAEIPRFGDLLLERVLEVTLRCGGIGYDLFSEVTRVFGDCTYTSFHHLLQARESLEHILRELHIK